jgi:hypothetical protein
MRKHALEPRTKESLRFPSPSERPVSRDDASDPAKTRRAGKFPVFKVPKGAPTLTLEMVKAAEAGD